MGYSGAARRESPGQLGRIECGVRRLFLPFTGGRFCTNEEDVIVEMMKSKYSPLRRGVAQPKVETGCVKSLMCESGFHNPANGGGILTPFMNKPPLSPLLRKEGMKRRG